MSKIGNTGTTPQSTPLTQTGKVKNEQTPTTPTAETAKGPSLQELRGTVGAGKMTGRADKIAQHAEVPTSKDEGLLQSLQSHLTKASFGVLSGGLSGGSASLFSDEKPATLKSGIADSVRNFAQQAMEAAKKAAEAAAEPRAKVSDDTPVFQDGALDKEKFLSEFTQFDEEKNMTSDDARRCGATSAIAVSAFNGGKEGLEKIANHMAKAHPEQTNLKDIAKKVKDGTATYGDMAVLSSTMSAYYSREDGMHGAELGSLLKDAGITPPTGGDPSKFPEGTSWPMMIDATPGNDRNVADHWVVVGKGKDGKAFIYDPWPKPGKPQLAKEGTPEFARMVRMVATNVPGRGFANR